MKKLIKSIALIFTTLCLLGCADASNSPEDLNNEKPIVLEDGTIVISNKVDDVIIGYNEWGTGMYSYYQSDSFKITELFEGNLPKAGDSVKFYWKGKSNKNIKNLYMLVDDIEYYKEEEKTKERWVHLLTEEQRVKPIKTDIKANEEFEIRGSITLSLDAINTVNIQLCCGAEDTDGPVHLYSTAEENKEVYDKYSYYVTHSEKLKVTTKGKIEYNKDTKKITFNTLPKITLSDGTTVDGTTEEGKKTLLEKGAFVLWARSNTENYWLLIGKDDGSIPGNWQDKDKDFNEYDISSHLGAYPYNVDCLYFELRDSEELKEDEIKHYCPVLAFNILKINE